MELIHNRSIQQKINNFEDHLIASVKDPDHFLVSLILHQAIEKALNTIKVNELVEKYNEQKKHINMYDIK